MAVQQHVVSLHAMTDAPSDASDRPFEARVLKCRNASARLADNVVVMLATWNNCLIAAGCLTDVNALNQPDALQNVDCPVDAGDPDTALARFQLVGDLLGAQAAVRFRKQLDDGLSGTAGAVSGLTKCLERQLGPARFDGLGHHRRVPHR